MNIKMDKFLGASYQDWDKLIQPLIELMTKEYRNGYELVITPIGAEIRQNSTVQTFLNNSITSSPTEMGESLSSEAIQEFWNKVFKRPEEMTKESGSLIK